MRGLVCGDRRWRDRSAIEREIILILGFVLPSDLVIHGGCGSRYWDGSRYRTQGADKLAGEVARDLNVHVEECPAEWGEYGRAAGPIRNQQMLDDWDPHVVLAFHRDLAKSKGTADMVRRAKKKGIPVIVVKE